MSTVRTGFEFDFASVPRIFWVLLPPTGLPDQPYGIAALIHDWLCRHRAIAGQPITRAECDRVFREVMEYVGVNKRIAATMYWAVRLAAIVAGIR